MMWFILILAGFFEVVGVIGMTKVNRSASIMSYLLLIGGFLLSFLCLSLAMKVIPMGTAYAVWTGIGAAGSTIVGMVFFGEPREKFRLIFISCIIISVAGLKLVG